MEIIHCKKCFFPETKPDLFFDAQGICSACVAAEQKKNIDWTAREKDFFEIVSHYKKNPSQAGYDCLIPVSGGKDSTYQAYFMKEVCGMNPLCVCFETTAVTEVGQKNLDNISKMGLDVVHFKKNYNVYKTMVVEGFKRVGDEMWPNHVGIFTIPVNFAVKFNIPLVIWGENSQMEYGGPINEIENKYLDRRWLEEFGGLIGNRIQDMVGVNGLTERDLTPYFYPSDEDIRRVGVTGLFLGYYFFWDARKQLDVVINKGFSVKEDGPLEGSYLNYEKIDEKMHSLHDYLKFVKYGFGRATDHAGIDIRNGRITREQGRELLLRYDGKYPIKAITEFIAYSGMTKSEVDAVIDSFTNPNLFKKDTQGKFTKDSDGNLIRNFEIQ